MRSLLALTVLALLAGCAPKSEDASPSSAPANNAATTSPTAQTTPGGGGVAPMTSGAAGGMTPMAGTDSVEGSGMGGLGSAAKDMARGAAAKASASPSMTGGSEGGE